MGADKSVAEHADMMRREIWGAIVVVACAVVVVLLRA